MSSAETVQAIQKALEPYIRPREEAAHIRRVLALNLRSCHEDGPRNGPLALVGPDCTVKSTDVRGLQRDYLQALHANIKAQREFEAASQQRAGYEARSADVRRQSDAGRLEEQIASVKSMRKHERLQALAKYLDVLSQKPAAASDFLQPQEIFRASMPLPSVPKTVVSSFTVDSSSTKTDLKALVDRLEKAVLRSMLLLRKEEQLLEQVKARSSVTPSRVSDGAKLAALHATRNELIMWMETELGKASVVEETRPEDAQRNGAKVEKAHMDEQLASIQDKYADYVAARKSLVQLVAQRPQIRPQQDPQTTAPSEAPAPPPSTYLITPYIEKLLSVGLEQKASVAQKAHLSNVLARQTEKTGKALARLAEESLLLPEHPGRRHEQRLGGDALHKKAQEITGRVQPWVAAADAAKLATLEAVAAKIEEGQVALETSTKHLAEMDRLLGRDATREAGSVDEDSAADDIWLAETQTPKKAWKAPTRNKTDSLKKPKDLWSLLDGNLGLINAENSPRK